jgi:hypothetical protein
MAFQVGSKVRPELGRADVSGFARAGEYYGQALANLGEQIGSAVTKYAVNKQKKEDKKLRYESILPYTTSMFGAEEGEKMAQTFSNDPKLGAQILEFAGMQQDQAALQQALAVSTTPEGDTDPNTILSSFINFGGRDVGKAAELIKEIRGPGELIVDPITGVVQQGGKFKGITRVPTKPVEPSVTEIDGVTFAQTAPNKWEVVEKDPSAPEPVIKELTDSKGDTYTVITVGGSSRIFQSEGPPIVVGDNGGDETKGDSLGLGL